MGVDYVTRLMVGMDVTHPGSDGRSFLDRVKAGEYGAYEEDPDAPFTSLEVHFVQRDDLQVLAAVDHYEGQETGAVVGKTILDVHNRGTPRNLSDGLGESELVGRLRQAQQELEKHGIREASFWLLSYAG